MSEEINIPNEFQYMGPTQVDRMRSEIASLRKQIENPTPGGADKGEMRKRVRRMESTLERQVPPDLTGDQRDALAREEIQLREQFQDHMPSAQEMRRNPPGIVSKQLEFNKRFAKAVFRWKQIRRLLNPRDTGPEVCSIETLRPHSRPTDKGMHDAQIPGKTFVGLDNSPAYKEGWDRTFGEKAAAEIQALRDELASLKSEIAKQDPQKTKKRAVRKVAVPCGKEIDARGRLMHLRQCKECKALEGADQEGGAAA